MSWGERSCKKPCRCPEKCKPHKCNVNCPDYIWDGKTKPDSKFKPKLPDIDDIMKLRKRNFWER
jgi:hypothetical protein